MRLDPSDVARAARVLLSKETERVDDPRPIPEDQAGWHAQRPISPGTAGAPLYDPESWRWFELVDVGFVDEMILIVVRWADPSTPELRYSSLAHADGLPSAEAVALVVRSYLRRLLEPGWRDRVSKRWLSSQQVLIWRDPTRHDQPPEVRDRRTRFQKDLHDAAWIARRDLEDD